MKKSYGDIKRKKLSITIEPKITTPQRNGFTVVEWGGVLKK
jgi:hypothetical protein